MTFEFTPHLTTLYPSTTYTTTPLSGGLVSFTVRAHRTSPPYHFYFTANPYQPHPQRVTCGTLPCTGEIIKPGGLH